LVTIAATNAATAKSAAVTVMMDRHTSTAGATVAAQDPHETNDDSKPAPQWRERLAITSSHKDGERGASKSS